MNEEIRRIGLAMGMPGTLLLEGIMEEKRTYEDLTPKEIREILDSWDTRNYVPIALLNTADRVKPTITEEEVQKGIYSHEEYEKDYAVKICKYLISLKFRRD